MQRLTWKISALVLGAGALAWSGLAKADDWRWNVVSPNDSQMTVHKDFSLVGDPSHTLADHQNQAFQPGNPVNYQTYTFQGGSAGRCLEISTSSAGTGPADTRFWSRDASLNFKSLNDDISPSNVFSRARYWVAPNTSGSLYIAAFNSASDNMEFLFTVLRISTTEAGCTTNQSLPWFKTNGNQFSANAS